MNFLVSFLQLVLGQILDPGSPTNVHTNTKCVSAFRIYYLCHSVYEHFVMSQMTYSRSIIDCDISSPTSSRQLRQKERDRERDREIFAERHQDA